jgi:hypothetical protein
MGVDKPDALWSDYELWTPNDGRHGESKCFLGQTVTYIRRKKDARCFNGEDHEPVVTRSACTCAEMDFECDFGYKRVDGSGTCQKQNSVLSPEAQQKEIVDR